MMTDAPQAYGLRGICRTWAPNQNSTCRYKDLAIEDLYAISERYHYEGNFAEKEPDGG